MNNSEKQSLRQKSGRKYFFVRMFIGINSFYQSPLKILALVAYLVGVILIWQNRQIILHYPDNGFLLPAINGLYNVLIPIAAAVGLIKLFELFGTPLDGQRVSENLIRIGLVNHAGEPPVLIGKQKSHEFKSCIIMNFESHGLPRHIWEDKRLEIESALNLNVVKVEEGKNKRQIMLYVISAETSLPKELYWTDDYLSNENFVLRLGESLIGPVTVNLAKIPHILLGGSTGSGKSILLKVLLMECVKKGAEVIIADFKGGVDFPAVWHNKCRFITSESELLEVLDDIVGELNRRKDLLALTENSNIDEYNKATGKNLPRIVVSCDELAEVLDKTGLSKGGKEIISSIEGRLSTIARLGRAFSINLILSTQRADATVVPGQIRNNIGYRICGRADEKILSQVILENSDAAERIPAGAQGIFVKNDNGPIFQGYLIDEQSVFN